MSPQLRRILAGLKAFWLALVLVVVVVLLGWIYLVNKIKKKADGDSIPGETPSLVRIVANRVQDAVTDAKVETAVIKSTSNERRKEIEEIRSEPDGVKRRERLASVLRNGI